MELHETGIGEGRAAPVRPPDGGGVGGLRVRGQEVDVRVAAGGQHHRVGQMHLQGARDQVARDHPARPPVHHDEIQHLPPRQHRHPARRLLLRERAVGSEQELLAGLPARVERARDQRAPERAIGEVAAVLAGEGHALGHRVVDDAGGELGQPVHVGLARAEIPALQGVVEEPLHAVAVVLVVLGRVDPALRGHAVGPTGRVVEHEAAHAIPQLGEGGRRGGAGQARAHHEHGVMAAPGGADQGQGVPVARPARGQGAGRSARGERRRHRSHPASTARGTAANPSVTAAETRATAGRRRRAAPSGQTPRLRAAAQRPWKRWRPSRPAAAP